MSTITIPKSQMILTLETDAMVNDIKKALRLIKGVASVRLVKADDAGRISPALQRKINKARKEYAAGETVKCSTPEEMQRYFDSL